MGQISNRILISSVNDGTTIHGALRATKSLTQGWDGAACSPDWENDETTGGQTNPFYHPVIYLTLFNGNTQIPPTTFKWYYNGIELTFNPSGMSVNTGMENWFKSSNEDPDGASGIEATECLTLCHNLAGVNNNLDIDLISIKGTVEMGGAQVAFEAGIDITLTKVSATGYLGVLSFQNGKSTLDGDTDSVRINAYLYRNGSLVNTSDWLARWEVNGSASAATTQYLTLTGSQVTDIATVVCKFYHNAKGATSPTDQYLQYTGMVVVDDVGDPEYLYIRYTIAGTTSNNDGAPVSLHSGQSVTYKMWVARSDNSNNPYALTKLEVQSHKADGTLVTSSTAPTVFANSSSNLKTAGNYDGNGWCKIGEKPSGGSYSPNVKTDNGSTDANGGTFTVHYDDVSGAGANISMIVRATLA